MDKILVVFLSSLLFLSFVSADYGSSYKSGADNSGSLSLSGNSIGLPTDANINTQSDVEIKGDSNINKQGKGLLIKQELMANKKTKLNFSEEDNDSDSIKVSLSNGRFASVKILPSTASAVALENMKAKCAENNCTVELKETGRGDDMKAVYEVKAQKPVKVFGIFKKDMKVKADVDAETSVVIKTHKPWWSFLASEESSISAYSED